MNMLSVVSLQDQVAPPFDLQERLESATVETVFLEALENMRDMMIFERPDMVTRRYMEAHLHGMLGHLLNLRVVQGVSCALFTDYSIRDLPNNGARVTFTGRSFVGDEVITYQKDFQFKGNLLPIWAKQQLREGLGMVSLVHWSLVHRSKVLFRLF